MKAIIRNTEIYFDVAGMQVEVKKDKLHKKPTLFLLHGGPGGNHLHFKTDSIALQKYAQLIFIDHRGCGWSKKTNKSDYTLENNIEDIEALRKYLGLEKIALLGLSYGGIVAQGYAIKYSKNLEKLILVATTPSYRFIEEAKQHLNKIGTTKQINICNKHLWHGKFTNEKDVDKYFNAMTPLYYAKKQRRPKIKKTKQLNSTFSHQGLNAGFGDFLHHFDYTKKLKKITCPTLVLAGQEDWICSPSQSRIIAENIPNARLKVFKNCSHMVASDVHDKYINIVSKFLRE